VLAAITQIKRISVGVALAVALVAPLPTFAIGAGPGVALTIAGGIASVALAAAPNEPPEPC
jgi:hypothetical protein